MYKHKYTIMLNNPEEIKRFVHQMTAMPFNIDLVSGYYVVDAKSIMGIFSLDLTKPLLVGVNTDDTGELDDILAEYAVED